MDHISFLRPYLLLSLVAVVPVVATMLYLGYKARVESRLRYGEAKLVNRYSAIITKAFELTVGAAWLVALALLVVAAAGPTVQDAPSKVPSGTLQVVIVSDVSKSMAAEDYRAAMPPKDGLPPDQVPGSYGTRLQMAKQVIETQIMPAIIGNELGIATYCGNGFDQADLSDDFVALRWVLDNWVDIGNAPGGGSDYADGLDVALTIFDTNKAPDKEKVIVMFSDGGFTGDPAHLAQVLEQIHRRGIRIIIVGVGSDSPTPIPVYNTATGQLTGNMQKDGKTVTTAIDEAALQGLASQTGGTYIRLTPGQNLDVKWASKLSGNKTEIHEKHVFQYPLGLAIVLFLGLFLRGAIQSRRSRVLGAPGSIAQK